MKKLLITGFILLPALWASAQDSTHVAGTDPVATGLRANGKIYVVLAVALTILIGLIIYLVSLDRKISKLEKNA